MAEKIRDNRFLRLVRHMLKAGYLEEWEYHDTLSGVPQGGTVSPVLSNIYLDKLDKFVEQELIPQYTRGGRRRLNPEYNRTAMRLRRARKRGDRAEARDLLKQLRTLPRDDPMDPGYRRLKYTRYADDHILGFIGPKAEAGEIKARLAEFLRETLGLELNQDKTLITHARTQRARFLGYDISVWHCNTKITSGRRAANGKIALKVPPDVITAQCARYRKHGKPWHRPRLQNLDDYEIVRIYGAEYRGVVNYYLPAQDVSKLTRLRWHALTSLLKTLAAKHHSTVTKMAARYRAKTGTSDGLRTCFEARRHREGKPDLIARFGGIPLRQNRKAVIRDPAPARIPYPRKELAQTAPQTDMRALRDRHHGGRPPGHRPQRAREAGTGPARVGRAHGQNAAQDAHRLRRMPPAHPRSTGRTRGLNRWKAQCRRKVHAEFGGRLPGKGPVQPR